MSDIKIIFGALGEAWKSDETGPKVLDILTKEGIKNIDTARIYEGSEELLGKRGAAQRFTIDTKHPGGWRSEPATKANVLEIAEKSLGLIQTKQVDIYYLHSPDRKARLEDTLEGINELYKQGKIKRFGLSNFLTNEVEDVIRVATEKGYVLPTVYQGNYSAVARKVEDTLFPLLRKHNIAFYAYSPIAGGFLAKTRAQVLEGAARFDPESPVGKIYSTLYNKPTFLDALDKWGAISSENAIPKAELAYRWIAYHSALSKDYGDGIIVGARTPDQLTETIVGLRNGPLPEKAVEEIQGVWDIIKDDAGLDNFNLNNA
ncbi:hypothetical protein G7Z17_g540 [Cylindrodendrum hubeiense]|uniref:NADP-dependent oxidoreductase domain-containing protein n=1 Tax=Cylindrodendrum hubeiense TaxID=595255 RepID=A0A9P5HLC0_9HYPO|nr:hypothetical protein G7Z17_g540 [Cylindrodendrum hubeiense]